MSRKIALKRLTASDLSFFEFYFRVHPDVKQKAINMDSQILIEELYPSLPEVVENQANKRVPLDMYLYGPGLQAAHNLQRKILKQQKNWRLNGELVHGTVDFPERYNQLRPADFALFEFSGTLTPTSAKMLLIAAQEPHDAALHRAFAAAFPDGSMFALSSDQLETIIGAAQIEDGHPILDWSDESLAEDIALGGTQSAVRLTRRRQGRGMSPEDFQKSKSAAELVGVLGEELLNDYFMRLIEQHNLSSYEWISSVNAISPFDFRVVSQAGVASIVDAKSTSGVFQNAIHLSMGEILVAAEGQEPYDIYRIFKVTAESAALRIARNIGPVLRPVLESLRSLPQGVQIDSVSVDPSILPFEALEIKL